MDTHLVKLVIQFATNEDLVALDKAMNLFLGELRKENPSKQLASAYDIAYHRLLGKFSHNPIVENIYNFVIELFAPMINPIHRGVYEAHQHTATWIASHLSLS